MTFIEFFHENIFMFMVATGLLVYLLVTEFMQGSAKKHWLSSASFSRLVNDGAELVDLRDVDAYKQGHIVGAKNIPLSQFSEAITDLSKTKPIALYCDSGRSSGNALSQLKKSGFSEVYHLQGGIKQWLMDGLPLEKASS